MPSEDNVAGTPGRGTQIAQQLLRQAEENSRRMEQLLAESEQLRRDAEKEAAQLREQIRSERAKADSEIAQLHKQREALQAEINDIRARCLRAAQVLAQQAGTPVGGQEEPEGASGQPAQQAVIRNMPTIDRPATAGNRNQRQFSPLLMRDNQARSPDDGTSRPLQPGGGGNSETG